MDHAHLLQPQAVGELGTLPRRPAPRATGPRTDHGTRPRGHTPHGAYPPEQALLRPCQGSLDGQDGGRVPAPPP